MSILAISGAVFMALTGYAFIAGVAARYFRRMDIFHAANGTYDTGCRRVQERRWDTQPMTCNCHTWAWWGAFWPAVLIATGIWIIAVKPLIHAAKGGFALLPPHNHDKEAE